MSRQSISPRGVRRSGKFARSSQRSLIVEALESRCMMSATPMDIAIAAEVPAAPPTPIANVQYSITDLEGNPLDHVEVGDTFLLNAHVEDIRENPEGVFSMYFDLVYDAALIEVVGEIEHSDYYPSMPMGDASHPGIVSDAGGFSNSIKPLGSGKLLLYSIPMRAIAPGTATIAGDESDCGPVTEVGVYGNDEIVPSSHVDYGQATLQIGTGGKAALTRSELVQADLGCNRVNQVAPPIKYDLAQEEPWVQQQLLGVAGELAADGVILLYNNVVLDEAKANDLLRVLWLDDTDESTGELITNSPIEIPLLESTSTERFGLPVDDRNGGEQSSSASSAVDESLELIDEVFAHFGELADNLALS